LTASSVTHVRLGLHDAAGKISPLCITNRDTMIVMPSAISVRLDAEALRALAQLEATGLSRSEAIRRAILDSAARLQRRAALAAEVAALEADEDDRAEMLEVAAMMERMRAAG
jgi:Arc/MetJ-type ribon-helix-helix transcriptional regulator